MQLRDTILLAPGNAKSLADIGEIVGLPKIALANDPDEDVRIKENMKQFYIENWDLFRHYAIRDAEVCVRYAEKVMRQFDTLFETFKLPITLTQFGTKKVLQDWAERGWNSLTILGREKIETKQFVKKLGYFRKETKKPYQSKVHHNVSLAADTYHGGRNEQFAFGICDEGEWRDHDLSSAYTTAMSLIGTPNWETLRSFDSVDDLNITDLAYAVVDFEFPDAVRFPTLPVRTANGILFPRKGRSECSAPEIMLAKSLGAKMAIYEGVRVDSDKSVPIFKNFIVECIGERSKHPKGSFENLFWKEVGNSTYGKTAQGLREKRIYDHREDQMVLLPESEITQPYFASFITSYVRAVLGEILNAFPPDVQVFSVTTDGFLSNASDEQVLAATSGELFTSFSDARKALDVDSVPLEVKHQIRQPIGWRTRGSATLKCGSSNDNNIVLQKGGIKTNRFFNTIQENTFVAELFLNRYPEQTIQYTSGIGLKDMVRYEADFVSRSVTKRLSMEYDWKRRPLNSTDRSVEFNGTTYTHLSFDTEPLTDDVEFRNLRDAWDKYNDRTRKTLKSVADYEEFQRFLETQKLSKNSKRYLRKKDGAISRLRRDLTRAFKGQQAGFDKASARLGKISHQDFIEALASCGVSCKISDLDNAKRQVFKPHQSVREPQTMKAISLLKELYYPELDIDCFFETSNIS